MTDDLRALSEAATPGPWFVQGTLVHRPDKGGVNIGPLLMDVYAPNDAALIVAAVNYVRDLLSGAPRPDEGLREPRAIITEFGDVPDHADGSEHYWTDAPDDETGWYCTVCDATVYPHFFDDEGGDTE